MAFPVLLATQRKDHIMLRARDSFAVRVDGQTRVIGMGQTIDENHPLVREYPDKFEPIRADITYEQATAAPGEIRHVVPSTPDEQVAEKLNDEKPAASTPVEASEEENDDPLTKPIEDVDEYNLSELRALATRAGVETTGTKQNIVDRLNARFHNPGE